MKSRVAKEASAAFNVAKTLAFAVPFWATLLFWVPSLLFRLEIRIGVSHFPSPVLKAVGVCLFCLFGALGVSSGLILAVKGKGTPLPLDCPRQMAVAGAFAYVRNPMSIAGIMQGVAAGIYLSSPLTILYSLCGAIFWNYVMRPWEEKDLEERFGEEFREYRRAVRCWTPNLSPYQR